ncbi:MAG: CatA-like O-acetyltransferase [Pyrinomonadaceae bacterium]
MTSAFTEVDISGWARRTTFEFFRDYKDPYFNIAANVDVTKLRHFCRQNELSYSIAALFYAQQAANSIREFRLRMLGENVVEFESIEATQTILNDDETFSFCHFEHRPDVLEYVEAGRAARSKYLKLKTFDVETERIDLIYYSVIPWISFTSFKHASPGDNRQTVPRIVFGKIFKDGSRELMPLSVEAHHAMMDGIHVGRFFERFQAAVDSL